MSEYRLCYYSFDRLSCKLHSAFYFLHVLQTASCAVYLMSLLEIFDSGLVIFHVPFDVASIDKQIGVLALKILLLYTGNRTASL